MIELTTGKRKKAIARVRIKEGEKKIIINGKSLENFPEIFRLKVMEPLILYKNDNFDIKINVTGGGIMGQAEAIAQGIARGLIKIAGDEFKKKIMEYDRNLVIRDFRVTEPHKPSRSKKGARRHKQRSKR